MVSVVGVQHGAVGHGQAEVHRPAAAGVMGHVQRGDAPRLVKACVVSDAEIMPLAGDDHIVIAVIAHLAGFAGQRRGDRTGNRQRVALAFLATETAAHAPGLDPHGMHRATNGMGHFVLNFGRVLGRGMHQHVAVVLRQRHGGLTFEIEMLLPAHLDLAREAAAGLGERGLGIALLVDAGAVFEPAVGGERLLDGQDRVARGDLWFAQLRGATGSEVAGGHDQIERLAREMDFARRQKRLVMVRG